MSLWLLCKSLWCLNEQLFLPQTASDLHRWPLCFLKLRRHSLWFRTAFHFNSRFNFTNLVHLSTEGQFPTYIKHLHSVVWTGDLQLFDVMSEWTWRNPFSFLACPEILLLSTPEVDVPGTITLFVASAIWNTEVLNSDRVQIGTICLWIAQFKWTEDGNFSTKSCSNVGLLRCVTRPEAFSVDYGLLSPTSRLWLAVWRESSGEENEWWTSFWAWL